MPLFRSNNDPVTPIVFSEAWEYAWNRQLKSLLNAGFEYQRYQKHLKFAIGHLKLEEVTPLILEKIIAELTQKNYRPQTIKHILGLVRRVFNLFIKWGLFFGTNPVAFVDLPHIDNRRHRYLTVEEAISLLNALKERSETTWALSLLSLSTGMRAGEMLKLKGEHINFSDQTIKIIDSKNKCNRTVFLPDGALQMLIAMIFHCHL